MKITTTTKSVDTPVKRIGDVQAGQVFTRPGGRAAVMLDIGRYLYLDEPGRTYVTSEWKDLEVARIIPHTAVEASLTLPPE